MNDLDRLLHGAGDQIADATGPIDERDLTRVRGTVRRARIRRHTTTAVATLACVGVLGVGAAYAIGRTGPAPAPPADPTTTSTTTTPSATASPTSSPTPTTPAGPVERAAEIDDATVLARLTAPRTGEQWTGLTKETPPVPLISAQIDGWSTYRVGERGDATLYLAVSDESTQGAAVSYLLQGALLFEVDDDGARLPLCPSARTGDACLTTDMLGDVVDPDVTLDEDTFYDTLTLPAHIDAGDGWTFATDATRASEFVPPYGVPYLLNTPDATTSVVDLGPSALVETTEASDGPAGLSSHRYAIRLPFGGLVVLDDADLPNSSFDAITWDDGTQRTDTRDPGAIAPGGYVCLDQRYSTEPAHDEAAWREAGTTAEGARVYVPVEGGNDVSRAVRQFQDENSFGFGDEDPGYLYPTDAAFLEADALWAVAGPDGTWQLRLRTDAGAAVYECA